MAELLFKVEAVFSLQGRGPILHPATPPPAIRPGEEIRLRRPDGAEVATRIAGVSTSCRRGRPCLVTVVLPLDFDPKDVPEGTEVWRNQAPS